MKREPGFYWVRDDNEWIVARWVVEENWSGWQCTGSDEDLYYDDEFNEIDETKLERK